MSERCSASIDSKRSLDALRTLFDLRSNPLSEPYLEYLGSRNGVFPDERGSDVLMSWMCAAEMRGLWERRKGDAERP